MSRAHTNHVRTVLLSLLAAPALLAGCTSTVDPLSTATIADLTTAQAETWCANTYEPMFLVYADTNWPVQPDGTVLFGTGGGGVGVPEPHHGGAVAWNDKGLCLMQLPVDQCVANLKARPCQATVQQLDDCIQAFLPNQNWDARCATFHDAPSCSETIVAATIPDGGADRICDLPVE